VNTPDVKRSDKYRLRYDHMTLHQLICHHRNKSTLSPPWLTQDNPHYTLFIPICLNPDWYQTLKKSHTTHHLIYFKF